MCDYYTCCRLCLHEAKDGLNCLNVPRFILAIRQIFGFEITTKDKCSTKICHECIGKITNISMYRDFVLNNQTTIEDYQIFRSDILTLKTEYIISDEEDVIFLCENSPSEEPPNITTKVLSKKSPILTKQKQTARKRTGTPFPKWNSSIKLKNLKIICERIDYQKDKKKCKIADKKHDVLEAISSNEGVNPLKIVKTVAIGKKGQMTTYKVLEDSPKIKENKTDVKILRNSYKNKRKSVGICYADANREEKQQSPSKVSPQIELIRKEDNGQPEINVSSSKTLNESSVDLNLIKKEIEEERIKEVSPNYNNTSKEISKTNGSPVVERILLRNRDRQTAPKVYSNNKKNIKTVYKTRQSLANLNVTRQEVEEQEAAEVEEKEAKEVEEPEATKDSSNNNTARIEISKTDKETPQSPFEPKLLRKRDQPAKKGYSNSKTIDEISQPPVDSNLIKKEAKRQTAKEVSTKNYHASIEVSKTVKETSRSPDVESKLFRKRCKEPPQTKEYSNSKTINETPQPPVDSNLFAKEVKEQGATNISTNNNNANIEINKTVKETPRSPVVDSKLSRKRNREQPETKVCSNSKTINETPQPPVDANLIGKEVKEKAATNISTNNNNANIEINKTVKETPRSPVVDSKLSIKRNREHPETKVCSNSKTINETPQLPVDANLIGKEVKEKAATNISTNNNNANIEISKTVKETPRSSVVPSKLLRNKDREQPETNFYLNSNGLSTGKSNTVNQPPGSSVDSNLVRQEVEEQSAEKGSPTHNGENIIRRTVITTASSPVAESKLNDTKLSATPKKQAKELTPSSKSPLVNNLKIDIEKKIRSIFSKQAQPTKKQKLDTDSALVSTQNTAKSTTIINPYAVQKSVINSVSTNIPDQSTSKSSPSVATSKPVTIVHALPLTPILKPSVVQTNSTNPFKLTTHASQKAAEIPQQNQKDKGLSVSSTYTNTNADSEYVSLESFGRQFGASSVPGPSPSCTTSYNKPQLEKPLYPRFESMYQQQAANQKIQPVAPNNITSGIRPMNIDERSQVSTNFNNQPNSKSPPIELNHNKVKVLTVNQVNNSYLFNPSLNTSSSGNAMLFPYIITVPTSYNSTPTTSYNSIAPTFCNSTAPISNNYTVQPFYKSNAPPPYSFTGPTSLNSQNMYSATGPPFSSQQNVNIYQSNIASQYPSPMYKNMQQNQQSVWNGNALQNLNHTQAQDAETDMNSLTFSIRLLRLNNEIKIKISNKNEEISFNNMNKYQLDAVRKSILQPSSMAQINKAFKSFKPDVYSKELLKKLGIDSLFLKE